MNVSTQVLNFKNSFQQVARKNSISFEECCLKNERKENVVQMVSNSDDPVTLFDFEIGAKENYLKGNIRRSFYAHYSNRPKLIPGIRNLVLSYDFNLFVCNIT